MRSIGAIVRRTTTLCPALAFLAGAAPATCQTAEQFYAGKTLDMIIGFPAGGFNDTNARLAARHLGNHIPGKPKIIARNMPGGGSLVAANHIYTVARRDGTVLGLLSPTIPMDEKLGTAGIKFESARFNWIGRIGAAVNVAMIWHASPIMTVDDLKTRETTTGATGAGSVVAVYPNVLNHMFGTKFKIVMGYAGSAEAMLAMERGEVEAHTASWEAVNAMHPSWVKDGKIRVVVQFALARHRQLPHVPTAVDLARTPDDAATMKAMVASGDIGKSIMTGPELPTDRVEALRRAFDDMCKDPAFLADAQKSGVDISPMKGEELQKFIEDVGAISPAIVARVKGFYAMK